MYPGILLAVLAATIYGLLGICFQLAGRRHYDVFQVMLHKQFYGFLLGLSVTAYAGLPLWDRRLLVLGVLGGLVYLGSLGTYLMATRQRGIAASWTTINLSVTVPIFFSVLWFNDHLTLSKVLGISLVFASIGLIGSGSQTEENYRFTGTWLRWIAAAFLLNGWLAVMFRFVPENYGPLFTMYFYGSSFLWVAFFMIWKQHLPSSDLGLIGVSAGGALTHWSGIVLTIVALNLVAKSSSQAGIIVYPITNGFVIPIGVLLGMWLLKERATRRTWWGVVIGIVALSILFLP